MSKDIQVPRAPKTTAEVKEEEELRRLAELTVQKRLRKRITPSQRKALGQDPAKPWKHFLGGASTFPKMKKERLIVNCEVCGCGVLKEHLQRHLRRAHGHPLAK
jgi:hypothetical protein